MKEQFVNYDIAFKLKELGFSEECFGWYHTERTYREYDKKRLVIEPSVVRQIDGFGYSIIKTPLYQQAFKWFRDVHNIHGEVKILGGSNIHGLRKKGYEKIYIWEIHNLNDKMWSEGLSVSKEYFFHEEAQETCINEMIKLLEHGED